MAKNPRVRGLGLHLAFTLIDCQKERLMDFSKIYGVLKHIPYRIGMSLIDLPNNPILHSCFSPKNPLNYGLSGFSLLHESHIAIHTWPAELSCDCDVFSCYQFDWEKTLKMLSVFFRGIPVNISIVSRGDNR